MSTPASRPLVATWLLPQSGPCVCCHGSCCRMGSVGSALSCMPGPACGVAAETGPPQSLTRQSPLAVSTRHTCLAGGVCWVPGPERRKGGHPRVVLTPPVAGRISPAMNSPTPPASGPPAAVGGERGPPLRSRVRHGSPSCADYGCTRPECKAAARRARALSAGDIAEISGIADTLVRRLLRPDGARPLNIHRTTQDAIFGIHGQHQGHAHPDDHHSRHRRTPARRHRRLHRPSSWTRSARSPATPSRCTWAR